MRGLLFLLLLYPFAEIATLVMLADKIGAGWTLLFVIASALLGLTMLRNQKIGALLTLGAMFRQGEQVSIYSLLWPLRYVLAGVFFLIPGLISDVLAVLLLLPLKGPSITMRNGAATGPGSTPPGSNPDIIEGEYTRVDESVKHDRHLP